MRESAFQGLVQAGEVGEQTVDAGDREDAQHCGASGHQQPHLAAFG
jgi:hypothetical protein